MSSVLYHQPNIIVPGKFQSGNHILCPCHVNREADIVPQRTCFGNGREGNAALVLKKCSHDVGRSPNTRPVLATPSNRLRREILGECTYWGNGVSHSSFKVEHNAAL